MHFTGSSVVIPWLRRRIIKQ